MKTLERAFIDTTFEYARRLEVRGRLVKDIEAWQRDGSVMLTKWEQWRMIVELYRHDMANPEGA